MADLLGYLLQQLLDHMLHYFFVVLEAIEEQKSKKPNKSKEDQKSKKIKISKMLMKSEGEQVVRRYSSPLQWSIVTKCS